MKTRFFTGDGDNGESKIGNNKVSKSSPVIDLLGSLDELNSWVGFSKVEAQKNSAGLSDVAIPTVLKEVQEILFIIQAEVAGISFGYEKHPKTEEKHTRGLEETIGEIDTILPPLKSFVIVGGSELSARLDVARTFARRTERIAKRVSEEKELPTPLLQYLNRLSSLFFALARYVNFKLGYEEEHPNYSA
ncbi:MAG: cob(I)yrinic acid a,c-diamide adenosyltransferase [Candidatus Jorgensenbacteria bacterium]